VGLPVPSIRRYGRGLLCRGAESLLVAQRLHNRGPRFGILAGARRAGLDRTNQRGPAVPKTGRRSPWTVTPRLVQEIVISRHRFCAIKLSRRVRSRRPRLRLRRGSWPLASSSRWRRGS